MIKQRIVCILLHWYKQKLRFVDSVKEDYCKFSESMDYIATYRNECECGVVREYVKRRMIGYNDVFTFGHKSLHDASLAARVRLFKELTK